MIYYYVYRGKLDNFNIQAGIKSILFALVNPAALFLKLTRNIYVGNESPAK